MTATQEAKDILKEYVTIDKAKEQVQILIDLADEEPCFYDEYKFYCEVLNELEKCK